MKSGSLNFLEPSGPVQALMGLILLLAGVENYFSPTPSKAAPVLMRLSIQSWPFNPQAKLPGGKSDYCPQSTAKVENVCSSASTSS